MKMRNFSRDTQNRKMGNMGRDEKVITNYKINSQLNQTLCYESITTKHRGHHPY